jgi:hypothetical protein
MVNNPPEQPRSFRGISAAKSITAEVPEFTELTHALLKKKKERKKREEEEEKRSSRKKKKKKKQEKKRNQPPASDVPLFVPALQMMFSLLSGVPAFV